VFLLLQKDVEVRHVLKFARLREPHPSEGPKVSPGEGQFSCFETFNLRPSAIEPSDRLLGVWPKRACHTTSLSFQISHPLRVFFCVFGLTFGNILRDLQILMGTWVFVLPREALLIWFF